MAIEVLGKRLNGANSKAETLITDCDPHQAHLGMLSCLQYYSAAVKVSNYHVEPKN